MRQIKFIPINLEVTSDNHYVAILSETSLKSVFLFYLSISNKITHTVHCYHQGPRKIDNWGGTYAYIRVHKL